jgi:peptidoglycan/LPS O-acetylase OafA/YrhL
MKHPASPPKQQLLPLTGLRFFLALWVVVYHQNSHYLAPLMSRLPGPIACILQTGYVAVGLFFVLSGFVLSYAYSLAKPFSSKELKIFATARVARIYPTYCLGLLLMAPWVLLRVRGDVPATAVEMLRGALNASLLQSWIPSAALSWNSPGWSLSDEAFFYCCFPFIGVALWKLSRWRNILGVATLVWGFALLTPIIAFLAPIRPFGIAPATSSPWDGNPFWGPLLSFTPALRLGDFLVGVLIGRAYTKLRQQKHYLLGRGYWLYIPGVFLELLVLGHANILPLPFVQNGLLLPLHAIVLLGFALGGGIISRVLSTTPLVFLGNASYAMYIVHTPIFFWMDKLGKKFTGMPPTGTVWLMLYVFAVVGFSSLVFAFFEQPANRVLKAKLHACFQRPSLERGPSPKACSSIAR